MNTLDKYVAGFVIASLVVIALFIGGAYAVDNATTNSTVAQEEPTPAVNESNVPEAVNNSTQGATELKRSFNSEYGYENNVTIAQDGVITLQYTSEKRSGADLKDEMRSVAITYATVAAGNPEMGSLEIRANGIILTIPADSAIAHGNNKINEEAYFKTMRFDSMSE